MIDKTLLQNFQEVIRKLRELEQQETALREQITQEMLLNNILELDTSSLILKIQTRLRVWYPKKELESLIPEELLKKVRQEKEQQFLTCKLKEGEGE